jgi:3-mercaptopyruvate sulfurtransferase SseA
VVVVDAREPAAYNGWRLGGEARGGHIDGAVSLPLAWVDLLPESELRTTLAAKGVALDATIVVYGAGRKDSAALTKVLRELGGQRVLEYQVGLPAWAAEESLPMTWLPRHDRLVPPQWLRSVLQGEQPEHYSGKGLMLLEGGSGEPVDYRRGHIPGAAYLDVNALEAGPLWNRVSDVELEAALLAHGVTSDTLVVLYGRDATAASRVAAILMYAGVDDVRLLDGGVRAWLAAGYGLERGVHQPPAVGTFGSEVPAHPEYIVDLAEARAEVTADNALLVDLRSWAEYMGKTSGYSYIEAKGHIAGAVWGRPGLLPHRLDQLRNVDGTMRCHHELEANWRTCGITPEKRIVFYCGTGWRASEAFFYAYLMGWPDVAVYDGGWHEWSADPANPIATGETE